MSFFDFLASILSDPSWRLLGGVAVGVILGTVAIVGGIFVGEWIADRWGWGWNLLFGPLVAALFIFVVLFGTWIAMGGK